MLGVGVAMAEHEIGFHVMLPASNVTVCLFHSAAYSVLKTSALTCRVSPTGATKCCYCTDLLLPIVTIEEVCPKNSADCRLVSVNIGGIQK